MGYKNHYRWHLETIMPILPLLLSRSMATCPSSDWHLVFTNKKQTGEEKPELHLVTSKIYILPRFLYFKIKWKCTLKLLVWKSWFHVPGFVSIKQRNLYSTVETHQLNNYIWIPMLFTVDFYSIWSCLLVPACTVLLSVFSEWGRSCHGKSIALDLGISAFKSQIPHLQEHHFFDPNFSHV